MGTPPQSDPRSDAELIDALNGGDVSAFDGIYYRYRDWVARLAGRFTGNGEDALDVLQETFSYVFRKFPGFRLTAAMTTFLYPVVKNLSIAAREKRGRFGGAAQLLDETAAEVSHDVDVSRRELGIVLSGLPEAQREVVLMRFVDGFSLEEIAIALSIPVGTAKSRLHNALGALRQDERLKDYFND